MPDQTDGPAPKWIPTGAIDRRVFFLVLGAVTAGLAGCASNRVSEPASVSGTDAAPDIPLPDTRRAGEPGGLLDVIEARRSVRAFADEPLPDGHVATILRAAQGVTDPVRGFRAAPSAGALYPLELYAASATGVLRYLPGKDALEPISDGDVRDRLAIAALGQSFVAEAPVVFVITGVYARTAGKYGDRAARYVHMEAGHAAQNILLSAVGLGLGSVPVGAFVDDAVRLIIRAPEEEVPLCLLPVGVPAGRGG